MEKKGTILLFQVNIFKQNEIRSLCRDLDLEVRIIDPADYGKTLGELAGSGGTKVSRKPALLNSRRPSLGSPGFAAERIADIASGNRISDFHQITDEMMLMCGLSDRKLDEFLEKYRTAGISPIPLKAVLTSENMKWSAYGLFREISAEHEAVKAKNSRR